MNTAFDQRKYIQQYMRERYKRLVVLLNRTKDADIIEHLNRQKSISDYVKSVIRKDMKGDNKQ